MLLWRRIGNLVWEFVGLGWLDFFFFFILAWIPAIYIVHYIGDLALSTRLEYCRINYDRNEFGSFSSPFYYQESPDKTRNIYFGGCPEMIRRGVGNPLPRQYDR